MHDECNLTIWLIFLCTIIFFYSIRNRQYIDEVASIKYRGALLVPTFYDSAGRALTPPPPTVTQNYPTITPPGRPQAGTGLNIQG